jgi:predicted nucleotidyltransferase
MRHRAPYWTISYISCCSDILRALQDGGLTGAAGRAVDELVSDAQECFGSDLISVTLYGSAAENRLRRSSDVNIVFVFSILDSVALERFAPKLAFARASAPIVVMFLKETEIRAAIELFAQKFSDIHRRHKVLYGRDCFGDAKPSRQATILRLRQVLLNLTLRLRESFAERVSQPDRLAGAVADFVSPLRACAATLRELKGQPILAPKEALEQFVGDIEGHNVSWLPHVSEARERRPLTNAAAIATVKSLLSTAERMRGDGNYLPIAELLFHLDLARQALAAGRTRRLAS